MTTSLRHLGLTGAALAFFLMAGCGTPGSASQVLGNGNNATTTQSTASSSAITIGTSAPAFTLEKLSGKGNVSLKDLLGAKPIIINAWASWCGPCQDEEPELESLATQYGSKVTVIGVNMTAEDSVSGAKTFVSKYHVTYPVLLDKKGEFLTKYQLVGFPTTFLIRPNGKIEVVHAGAMTKSQLQDLFKQAAAGA